MRSTEQLGTPRIYRGAVPKLGDKALQGLVPQLSDQFSDAVVCGAFGGDRSFYSSDGEIAGTSIIGTRDDNQDVLYVHPSKKLVFVGDGIGGAPLGGEAATAAALGVATGVEYGYAFSELLNCARRALWIAYEKALPLFGNQVVLQPTSGLTMAMVQQRGNCLNWSRVGDARIHCIDVDARKLVYVSPDEDIFHDELDTLTLLNQQRGLPWRCAQNGAWNDLLCENIALMQEEQDAGRRRSLFKTSQYDNQERVRRRAIGGGIFDGLDSANQKRAECALPWEFCDPSITNALTVYYGFTRDLEICEMPNDRRFIFVLCSDGASIMIPEEMLAIVMENVDKNQPHLIPRDVVKLSCGRHMQDPFYMPIGGSLCRIRRLFGDNATCAMLDTGSP